MTDDHDPREPRMLTYDVPLRPVDPRRARLILPDDLTAAEAERLAAVIRAVAFEPSTEEVRQAAGLMGMSAPLLVPKGCQVHGPHPHDGRVCIDCSTCMVKHTTTENANPPHIMVIEPGDSCWCGATIASGPAEHTTRAHTARAATQEELADDPGRAE